jgi:hypothetical protein
VQVAQLLVQQLQELALQRGAGEPVDDKSRVVGFARLVHQDRLQQPVDHKGIGQQLPVVHAPLGLVAVLQ